MTRTIFPSSRYKRDLKRIRNNLKLLSDLTSIIADLAADKPLDPSCRDHELSNNWSGFLDCHVRPDLVLIYQKTDAEIRILRLERLGSHAELFG